MPIATGECLTRRQSFLSWFEARALDIVQPDVTKVGGLSEQIQIARMANAFGIRYIGHGWNTAVGLAADLQLASALPTADLVEYIGGSPYIDDITSAAGRSMPRAPRRAATTSLPLASVRRHGPQLRASTRTGRLHRRDGRHQGRAHCRATSGSARENDELGISRVPVRWMPASLLGKDQRGGLVDAVMAASRHFAVAFHFNKGLAGTDVDDVAGGEGQSDEPGCTKRLRSGDHCWRRPGRLCGLGRKGH